jgi:hypothetical protein
MSGEDYSKHPMYITLSSRLAATESAISSLSAQVSTLSDIVSRALPSTSPSGSGAELDKPESIAALTQQISALSTSVAQLQRLQSVSQTQTRQVSRGDARDTLPALGLGSLSLHSQNVFNTGPLTAPHGGTGPFNKHTQRDFHPHPPPSTQGQGRPQNSRSVSTNMVPPSGLDGDKTWGPPTRGGGNPLSPGGWPTSALLNGGNVPTTPGGQGQGQGQGHGMMTPSITGPVGNGNGNGNGGAGPGVPGAGIVVTKWDHLNLKPELVRSIQKYG